VACAVTYRRDERILAVATISRDLQSLQAERAMDVAPWFDPVDRTNAASAAVEVLTTADAVKALKLSAETKAAYKAPSK
jgi:hypothetical protein